MGLKIFSVAQQWWRGQTVFWNWIPNLLLHIQHVGPVGPRPSPLLHGARAGPTCACEGESPSLRDTSIRTSDGEYWQHGGFWSEQLTTDLIQCKWLRCRIICSKVWLKADIHYSYAYPAANRPASDWSLYGCRRPAPDHWNQAWD